MDVCVCDSLLGDQNNFGLLEGVPCLLSACRTVAVPQGRKAMLTQW